MKIKSSLKLIPLCFLPLLSCGQQAAKQQDAATTFKNLKIPENQVLYEVTVEAENTPYRVFINDIPLMTSKISGRIKFFANPAVVKSGKQQVKVDYKTKPGSAGDNLQVKVAETAWQKGGGTKTPVVIWEYQQKDGAAAQGTFNASVPVSLPNWEPSMALKADDRQLISKAEAWFKTMADYLEAGKGDAFMNGLLKAESLVYQLNYFTPEKALAQHNQWKNYINKGGLKLAGVQNAKIEIVGNGKLLHLVNPSGEGALAILHGSRRTIFDVFLHFPKGEDEPEAILLNMAEY